MTEVLRLADCLRLYNGKAVAKKEDGTYDVFGSNGIIGKSDKFLFDKGLVIGRVGAYCGSVFLVKKKFWPTDNTIVAIPKGDYDLLFFYYLLKYHRLEFFAGGAAQPLLTQNILKKLEVRIPCIEVQKRISSILSAYDDLIEVNLKRIKLLEEAADLIYREWFVNFRFPGYKNTKFMDGIPEGWFLSNIADLLEHFIGGGWGKDSVSYDFCEPAYVIRGTDFQALKTGSFKSVPYRFHKRSNLQSRALKIHDIIFEVSGGSKDQPVGRSTIITSSLSGRFNLEFMCASFCKLLRPKQAFLSTYLYLFFRFAYQSNQLSPYQKLSASNIMNFAFEEFIAETYLIIPDKEISCSFHDLIWPLIEQVYNLSVFNEALKSARDILLPKLMSGEIEV